MTARLSLTDGNGAAIALGPLIGRGGEGAVYEVLGSRDLVAKLYHKPISTEKVIKLEAMASTGTDDLRKFSAWPTTVLRTSHGTPMGITMPRVSGHSDIHFLYSPKSRKNHFPEASYKFLIHTAANISRAFATLHAAHCVIGDVNHGSILVSRQATVKLIDCDSFQITANRKTFRCMVGVPTFTPAELQGHSFSNVTRTQNHDAFGLAVMVFHLLFMGRHPFSGRFRRSGDMPIEKAISEFRFAFSSNRNATEMDPPPGAPLLETVSLALRSMFEAAFSKQGATQARPTALQWVTELGNFERELAQCRQNVSHWHFNNLKACPWCAIEQSTGTILFYFVLTPHTGTGSAFNLQAVLAQIQAVPPLGPPPSLPAEQSVSAMPNATLPKKPPLRFLAENQVGVGWFIFIATIVGMATVGPAAIVIGIIAWVAANALGKDTNDYKEYRKQVDAIEATVRSAEDRWRQFQNQWRSDNAAVRFEDRRRQLEKSKNDLQSLSNERRLRMEQLHRDVQKAQLRKYLETFFIERATIPDFGPGRKATLASYGIETAWDVTQHKIVSVPGFGNKLAGRLVAWRRSVETSFRFDSSRGVDPMDIVTMDREIADKKRKLESELEQGVVELQHLRAQAVNERTAKLRQASFVLQELAQAKANLHAAKS